MTRVGQVQNEQVVDAVLAVARPAFTDLALAVVSCEYRRETVGWVLRLFIEGLGGASVSVEDCSRASRELSVLLDAAGIPELDAARYSLEVSSPGLDRPLADTQDFERFSGKKARIRLIEPYEGSRNLVGVLRGIEGGTVLLERDGRVAALAVENLARANLEPEWPEPRQVGRK